MPAYDPRVHGRGEPGTAVAVTTDGGTVADPWGGRADAARTRRRLRRRTAAAGPRPDAAGEAGTAPPRRDHPARSTAPPYA